MKIGLNGRFLLHPYTGIGQYTRHLLAAMAESDPSIEWVVAIPHKLKSTQALPSQVRLMVVPEKRMRSAGLKKWVWEHVQVPRFFRREKIDIAHFPYASNPRCPRLAYFPGKPPKTVVTLHDTIPWERPEYRKHPKSRFYQNHAKKALAKADHIIAVSQTTALSLSDHMIYPYQNVTVIPEAPDPIFYKRIKKKRLKRPYLLYVGGYDPRKNIKRLIAAFQEYSAPKFGVDLVLVGAKALDQAQYKTFAGTKELKALLEKKGQSLPLKKGGRILTTPLLSAHELAAYYRGALGFVNLSLEEGFNLPLLEAAVCGVPMIVSDIPVHEEVLGKNALFCDPTSTKQIGEKLIDFLQDHELQDKLRQATAKIHAPYSWKKTAEKTIRLYRSLM